MKIKQLVAKNPMTNVTITERYIDGIKYLKVSPFSLMPLISEGIIKQAGAAVITELKNGWLKIMKTGQGNEKLEQAGEKFIEKEGKDKEDVDEDYILNTEAKMLKSLGFVVRIEEI